MKGPPNDIYFIIEGPCDGYFTEKVSQARDDLSGCGHDLTGNAGSGVLRKTGIHHRVRDGVAELVGMSLGD